MSENGINHLGRVLQKRMCAVSTQPPMVDTATVLPGGALRADSYDLTIPREDYLVCRAGGSWFPSEGQRVALLWSEEDVIVLGSLEESEREEVNVHELVPNV